MEVSILDVKSLKIVYSYKLALAEKDQGPSMNDLFVIAWRCAIADGVVEEQNREQYILSSPLESDSR